MWIALKKVPVTEKSVPSIKDQREYILLHTIINLWIFTVGHAKHDVNHYYGQISVPQDTCNQLLL